METHSEFQRFLEDKNSDINGAAYELAVALMQVRPQDNTIDILPWDMGIIGEIIDSVEAVLKGHGHISCHPYFEDDVLCSKTDSCENENCPFKGNSEEEKAE